MPRRSKPKGPSEAEVARQWQETASPGGRLRTTAGQRVQVLYPGRPGPPSGPDFRDALVVVPGVGLVQGDVEVHVDQQAWRGHGHQRDPRYNGVVLHVVHRPRPGETLVEAGRAVPSVALGPSKEAAPGGGQDGKASPFAWYRRLPEAELGQLLDQAGDRRFLARSRSLGERLAREERDQVLYEELMEALGYAENRQPFRALAQALPWGALRRRALAAPPPERRTLLESLLLGRAGLLPSSPSLEGAQEVGMAPKAPPWRLSGVRPGNHPRRRLMGAAALLAPLVELGLGRVMEEWLQAPRASLLAAHLQAPAQGRPPPALIGEGRARDIVVNVLLPLFHAAAQERKDAPREARTLALYRAMPLLEENTITREMRRLLLPQESRLVRGARRQQGLIHLYQAVVARPRETP